MPYLLDITLVDEDNNVQFWHEVEIIERHLLTEEETPDFGAIFRAMRSEHGRCQSSIYVDTKEGPPRKIGWYFLKREHYDERRYYGEPLTVHNSYLRGAWITLYEEVEPAREAVLAPVTIT